MAPTYSESPDWLEGVFKESLVRSYNKPISPLWRVEAGEDGQMLLREEQPFGDLRQRAEDHKCEEESLEHDLQEVAQGLVDLKQTINASRLKTAAEVAQQAAPAAPQPAAAPQKTNSVEEFFNSNPNVYDATVVDSKGNLHEIGKPGEGRMVVMPLKQYYQRGNPEVVNVEQWLDQVGAVRFLGQGQQ